MMNQLHDEFTSISKTMWKTVMCKHSLPSQSHHLPQPETISALAAAIMRSSWKSNEGLQREQLYTGIIPLGCYGMFFHQTTVCQALVQMEKSTYMFVRGHRFICYLLARMMMIILNYLRFFFVCLFVLPAILLAGCVCGHCTVSHTACWQFPNG